MKKILYFLPFLIFPVTVFCQSYTPIDTANVPVRTEAVNQYKEDSKLFFNSIKGDYNSGERSLIKKRFESIDKQIVEDIEKGNFVFDDRFDKFTNEVVSEIVSKNPDVPNDLKFYVLRNIALNASSVGNKCFLVNMGAYYYLQNQDQFASVIAHEIAHFLLKHHLKDIQRAYALEKNSSTRDEIYEIKSGKYNRGDKAFNKLKKILYEGGNYNRNQEFEADSLGYVLIRNTKYNRADYINSFKLTEAYDTIRPAEVDTSIYKVVFNLPNQPFKEEWLKMEDFSGYDYSKYKDKLDDDSLSSHPETVERIDHLKKEFPELAMDGDTATASNEFRSLRRIVKFEQPPTLMIGEEYGFGIYVCLYRIQNNDETDYYKSWLGQLFDKIYEARKNYTLNRYLDKVEPKDQPVSYQQFLNFMWNLKLNEIKNIADYYNKKGS